MIDLTPTTTIAELIADGCTHLEASCKCGRRTDTPFRMGLFPTFATLGDIAMRMRCRRCGERPATLRGKPPYDSGLRGSCWEDRYYTETPEQKALRFLNGEPLEPGQE